MEVGKDSLLKKIQSEIHQYEFKFAYYNEATKSIICSIYKPDDYKNGDIKYYILKLNFDETNNEYKIDFV